MAFACDDDADEDDDDDDDDDMERARGIAFISAAMATMDGSYVRAMSASRTERSMESKASSSIIVHAVAFETIRCVSSSSRQGSCCCRCCC